MCPLFEGDAVTIQPAQRSFRDGLGTSVHGPFRDPGNEGGTHSRGEIRCREPPRDSQFDGRVNGTWSLLRLICVGSLAYALRFGSGFSSLTFQVKRVQILLQEFRVAKRRHGGTGLGHSPAHVVPLPPLDSDWRSTFARGSGFLKAPCPELLESANL